MDVIFAFLLLGLIVAAPIVLKVVLIKIVEFIFGSDEQKIGRTKDVKNFEVEKTDRNEKQLGSEDEQKSGQPKSVGYKWTKERIRNLLFDLAVLGVSVYAGPRFFGLFLIGIPAAEFIRSKMRYPSKLMAMAFSIQFVSTILTVDMMVNRHEYQPVAIITTAIFTLAVIWLLLRPGIIPVTILSLYHTVKFTALAKVFVQLNPTEFIFRDTFGRLVYAVMAVYYMINGLRKISRVEAVLEHKKSPSL